MSFIFTKSYRAGRFTELLDRWVVIALYKIDLMSFGDQFETQCASCGDRFVFVIRHTINDGLALWWQMRQHHLKECKPIDLKSVGHTTDIWFYDENTGYEHDGVPDSGLKLLDSDLKLNDDEMYLGGWK